MKDVGGKDVGGKDNGGKDGLQQKGDQPTSRMPAQKDDAPSAKDGSKTNGKDGDVTKPPAGNANDPQSGSGGLEAIAKKLEEMGLNDAAASLRGMSGGKQSNPLDEMFNQAGKNGAKPGEAEGAGGPNGAPSGFKADPAKGDQAGGADGGCPGCGNCGGGAGADPKAGGAGGAKGGGGPGGAEGGGAGPKAGGPGGAKGGGGSGGGGSGGGGKGEGVEPGGDAPSGNEVVDQMVQDGQLKGPQNMLDQTAELANKDPDFAKALQKMDEQDKPINLKEGQLDGNTVGLAESNGNGFTITSENGTDQTLAHEWNHVFDFAKVTSGNGHDATFEKNLQALMDGKDTGLA